MTDARSCRASNLPADAAPGHAGRARGPAAARQWGENSEALFLTSSFVQPDAATAARALRQRGRGLHLQPLLQPDGDDDRAPAGRAGRHRAAASPPPAAWRRSCCIVHGPAEGRRPRRSARAACSARPSSCSAASSRKFGVETTLRLADRRRRSGARRCGPNTKLLFAETPTNPLTEVCDIRALADIAHDGRRAAGGGQLLLLAGAAAADRAGRRPRHAFRHQVPRRPGPRDRRRRLRPERAHRRRSSCR